MFGRRHRPARLHPELMAEALRLLASDTLADRLQAAQLLARAYALDEEWRLAEQPLVEQTDGYDEELPRLPVAGAADDER